MTNIQKIETNLITIIIDEITRLINKDKTKQEVRKAIITLVEGMEIYALSKPSPKFFQDVKSYWVDGWIDQEHDKYLQKLEANRGKWLDERSI